MPSFVKNRKTPTIMTTHTSVPEESSRTAPAVLTTAQPYLFFDGRCEEALAFYRQAAGATITMLMRYRDNPTPSAAADGMPPADKIMHATFRIGGSYLNASDGDCTGKPKFDGFAVSLTVPTVPEAERLYAALSAGGEIVVPIGPTFFSPKFGMFNDRFGVKWIVYVAPPQA